MKDATPVTIDEALDAFPRFSAVLDARSPAEHAEDHLPGAISTPVLDDLERARVGTLHKQTGAFEAKRVGAALVSRNIAGILEHQLAAMPRDFSPLVYCWRGGNRSGALATVLARIGWRVSVLQGGYRAFRRRVIDDLAILPARLRFIVLAGRTGSGKSLLLQTLAARGAQVLDLEQIARHRGSVLGHLPGHVQPSQKHFETLLWDRIRGFDPDRPVFVESESRKVGQCQVPEGLILPMRQAVCAVIDTSDKVRATLLLREYQHFVDAPEKLAQRLEALVPLHGHERIRQWMAAANAGFWDDFVVALLHQHYDPAYDRSMQRNFTRIDRAPVVRLDGVAPDALEGAVDALLTIGAGVRPDAPGGSGHEQTPAR